MDYGFSVINKKCSTVITVIYTSNDVITFLDINTRLKIQRGL